MSYSHDTRSHKATRIKDRSQFNKLGYEWASSLLKTPYFNSIHFKAFCSLLITYWVIPVDDRQNFRVARQTIFCFVKNNHNFAWWWRYGDINWTSTKKVPCRRGNGSTWTILKRTNGLTAQSQYSADNTVLQIFRSCLLPMTKALFLINFWTQNPKMAINIAD